MKNKKLFAIVTLVCFLFTLIPITAFASEKPDSPTNLQWNTTGSDTDIVKYGVLSWDDVSPDRYDVCFYKDGMFITNYLILDWSKWLVDGRVYFAIADLIDETGEYTFAVQAIDEQEVNGEKIYLHSEIAVSDSWTYHCPEEALDIPTGLMWEGTIAYWQGVDGTTCYDLNCYEDGNACAGYGAGGGVIQKSDYDAERGLYYHDFKNIMNKTNVVYTFDVRAISTDITKKTHSKVSARSIGHDGTSDDEFVDENPGAPDDDFVDENPGTSEDDATSGTFCDSLVWSFDGQGVLTISGSGPMELDVLPPWYHHLDDINNIVIENGVTSIGLCAFSSCDNLTSISIPDSITSIGERAFSYCSNLTSITIPRTVTQIGENAFNECTELTIYGYLNSYAETFAYENNIPFIDIPEAPVEDATSGTFCDNLFWSLDGQGVLNISGSGPMELDVLPPWYHHLDEINNIVIENGVTCIGLCAFSSCSNLTGITIPNSITSIGSGAFEGCENLTEIDIPANVTEIASDAFDGCERLTIYGYANSRAESYANENNIPFVAKSGSGTLGDNIVWTLDNNGMLTISGSGKMEIEELPPWYSMKDEINHVVIGDGITSIGKCAFLMCGNLTKVSLQESITEIGLGAFYDCDGLQEIELPKNVTTIDVEAFSCCDGLTAIECPNSLSIIGADAFSYCSNLMSIKIPKNVTAIDKTAFSECKGLTIYGYTNSCAETFAKESNIPFVNLNPIEPEAGVSNIIAVYPENGKMINFDNPSQGTSSINYRDAKLRIFFDKEIKATSGRAHLDFSVGTLEIHRMTDDAVVYRVQESTSLKGLSNDVLIWSTDLTNKAVRLENVKNSLDAGHSYYVTMPEGFIQFTDGSVSPAVKKGEWVFTASKSESKPLKYLVSYDLDGGAGMVVPNKFYNSGKTVSIITNNPTRAGYEFLGWSDGENLFKSGSTFVMPNKSVVLTAQWKALEPVELSYVRKMTETSLRYADPKTRESIENAIYNLLFKAQFRPTRAEAIVEQKLGMKADYTGSLKENEKWPYQNSDQMGSVINDAVLGNISIETAKGCMSYALFSTVYTYGNNGIKKEPLKNSKITAETIKNCIRTYVDPGERMSYRYGWHSDGSPKMHAIVYLGESADGTGFYSISYGGGRNSSGADHSLEVRFRTWSEFANTAQTLGLRDTNGGSYYNGTAQPAKNTVDRIDYHVACPVEVTIQLGDEILDSRNIEDGMIVSTSFGFMERQGEEIIGSLDYNQDYMVQINGTGNGTMTFTLEYYAEDAIVDTRQFVDYPIEEETVITTSGFSPNGAFVLYGNLEKDPWGAGINETVYESDVMYSSAYNGPDDENINDDEDTNIDSDSNSTGNISYAVSVNNVVKSEVIVPDNAVPTGVTVTVENIDYNTLNAAKAFVEKDDNLAVIGGRDSAAQIVVKPENAVTSFNHPVQLTVPVSKSALKDVEDVSKLTLALVTTDENGDTKLEYVGGIYDSKADTFAAYTDKPGDYVLVEKSDIVKIDMFIDNKASIINNDTAVNDVAPYISNDRTMVPVAFIMNHLGCQVDWINDERKVVITLPDGRQLSMIIDQEIPGFGAVPVIKNDRTMVPIAYIAYAMDAHVLWVEDERRVVIVK